MRRALVLFAVIFTLVSSVSAQTGSDNKGGMFAGFQYTRFTDGDLNLYGWNAAFEGNLNEWFSVVGEIAGGYGKVFGQSLNMHTFMVGPQFSARAERARGFFRILVGGANLSVSESSEAKATFVVGGGADIPISDRIAFRVFQFDYLRVGMENGVNSFRMATGPYFHF